MKAKLNKPLLVAILLLLAAGTILTAWGLRLEDRRMREDFMVGARILGSMIDPQRILRLKGSEADIASPDYQHLKKQLSLGRLANPECRFAYLMGLRPDGRSFSSWIRNRLIPRIIRLQARSIRKSRDPCGMSLQPARKLL
jgi:hypothetical protein